MYAGCRRIHADQRDHGNETSCRHEQRNDAAELRGSECDFFFENSAREIADAAQKNDGPGQKRKRAGVNAFGGPADAVVHARGRNRSAEAPGQRRCQYLQRAARDHAPSMHEPALLSGDLAHPLDVVVDEFLKIGAGQERARL
jgi:hypothetical protein